MGPPPIISMALSATDSPVTPLLLVLGLEPGWSPAVYAGGAPPCPRWLLPACPLSV